jgi:diguanylate cyclase
MTDLPGNDSADHSPSMLLDVIEDDAVATARPTDETWNVLVVDDDEDVHQATELAMRGVAIEGRSLTLLHAHTAQQALQLIAERPDIAVVLLDVVMETPDAGLRLVRQAREGLGRESLRIILRTGQPGYAPELETIRSWDINDYRTKSELTRVRLFTSLTSAIRSYRQIVALQQTRRGLEIVVRASTELSKLHGLRRFAEGLIIQLCALLDIHPDGLVCVQAAASDDDTARVIAAAGSYAKLMHRPLHEVDVPHIRQALEQCLSTQASAFEPHVALYFASSNGRGMAAFVDAPAIGEVERHLLEVFCASMSVGFENVLLYNELQDLAYNDQLLRIPNRNRFIELIEDHLRRPTGMTMAVLDVDDFAGINQTLGHGIGDGLLKALGERLGQCLGPDAAVARLAGDTFGVLGPDAAVNPDTLALALAEPFRVQGEQLHLSASSGLVRLPDEAHSGQELLKDAHIALKQAKDRHRGSSQYFSEAMGTDARERMRLLRGLREAFESRRLFVVYQPQVSLADGRTIGAEALLRWRTDDGSFVPPDRFIPLAEHSRLIVPIGEFVLRTACHQLKRLNDQGFTGFRMSANVSQAQFRSPGFLDMVARALRETGADPKHVELEITESMATEDFEFMLDVLADVKRTGVTVAIDDFGTGFSSLSMLRQLHVDRLKIDRTFVQQMGQQEGSGNFASMMVDLGRGLGIRVIAEGVETEAQRDALLGMGCPEAQGFLFARPMPADQLERWLHDTA